MQGKTILTCGCEYHEDTMGDIDSLIRTWEEEISTRDYDNPFVMAKISGVYCDECWKKMEELSHE